MSSSDFGRLQASAFGTKLALAASFLTDGATYVALNAGNYPVGITAGAGMLLSVYVSLYCLLGGTSFAAQGRGTRLSTTICGGPIIAILSFAATAAVVPRIATAMAAVISELQPEKPERPQPDGSFIWPHPESRP
jgi:hypothetical protein